MLLGQLYGKTTYLLTDNVTTLSETAQSQEDVDFSAEYCEQYLKGFITREKSLFKSYFTDDDLKVYGARAAVVANSLTAQGCSLERALRYSALVLYEVQLLLGIPHDLKLTAVFAASRSEANL